MHSNNTHKKTKNKFVVILIPILIIVLGFVVLAVLSGMAEKPEKKSQINLAPIVDVLSIKTQDVVFSISSQGSVIPRTETALISEVSGAVTSVSKKFLVGGYFTKGEVLLEIDPITYQVAVLQSEARLGAAEATYVEENARAEQAEDEWLLSGRPLEDAPLLALRLPQLQKAQADVKAAEADLKQAQIKLARTKIIAPYDALLKEKNVDIGQYVTSGVQLAKTFAVDYAEIRLPIKQHDIAFIDLPKINQTMSVNIAVDISLRLAGETFDPYCQRGCMPAPTGPGLRPDPGHRVEPAHGGVGGHRGRSQHHQDRYSARKVFYPGTGETQLCRGRGRVRARRGPGGRSPVDISRGGENRTRPEEHSPAMCFLGGQN